MKIEFYIASAAALSERLEAIFRLLGERDFTRPTKVSLFSRHLQMREPPSQQELFAVARQSSHDTCEITVLAGKIKVRWLYGSHAGMQSISGRLRLRDTGSGDELTAMLTQLSDLVEAVYGCADQEKKLLSDLVKYGAFFMPDRFIGLYWFNYFGPVYRKFLSLDDSIIDASFRASYSQNAAIALQMAASPDGSEFANAKAVALQWPYFIKYSESARLPEPVIPDLSDLTQRAAPASNVQSVASLIGEAEAFIADVGILARQFEDWARTFGDVPRTGEEFYRFLQQREETLTKERIRSAVAAYGERIRSKNNGRWRMARFFHRGEPVVTAAKFPWLTRRPVYEILRVLSD